MQFIIERSEALSYCCSGRGGRRLNQVLCRAVPASVHALELDFFCVSHGGPEIEQMEDEIFTRFLDAVNCVSKLT